MALPQDLQDASENLKVISDIVNGGPGNVVTPSGRVHQTLASILGYLATEGNIYPPEVNALLAAIEADISNLEGIVNDLVAPADSAYAAQQSELNAQAADTAVRLSAAMTLPDNFLEGSRYWTNQFGEGQPINVAATMPLPGTFENIPGKGRVYRTEASPADDNSFATLGVVRGVPGKRVILEAEVSAVNINSSGGEHSRIGVAMVALNADFTVLEYLPGGNSYDFLEPSAGIVKIRFDFVMPNNPAPWYRMRLYYNFNETSAVQGNQQFDISYLHTEQLLPTEFQFQPTNPALTAISEASPVEGDILQHQSGNWVAVGADEFVQSLIDLGIFAPTENPDFTGTPLTANPASNSNSRQIANTQWVRNRLAPITGTPPAELDSLQKLAAAVGNNPDFAAWVVDQFAAGAGGATAIPAITHLTAGSGNFAPPTGCRYLEVTIKGGGGGGAGSGTTPGAGTDGAATTFGVFTAGPGKGAVGANGGDGGAATGGSGGVRHSGQPGGYATGGYTFAPGGRGGGAKGPIALGSANGPNAPDNSGCGGAGGGVDNVADAGGGGGEGADLTVIISTPTNPIAYSVGTGGNGGTAGTGGRTGGNGGSGEIIIKAFT